MKIVKIPEKILREKAKEVVFPLSDEVKEIIENMIQYIDDSQKEGSKVRPGVGIAAPQVGHSLRMFYVNVQHGENTMQEFLINPKVIANSESYGALSHGEGCLSVDEEKHQGLVHRKLRIIIEGYSYLQKKIIKMDETGINAIVLQHEYDHLEGKLFFDRIDKKNPWKEKDNETLI